MIPPAAADLRPNMVKSATIIRIVVLSTGQWNPMEGRRAVEVGLVGEPILISSQKSYKYGAERPWFYKGRKTYGGTIPWAGIHALDFMRWVADQRLPVIRRSWPDP